MKTHILFIALLLFISGHAMAQHQGNNGWKHYKKVQKKERKWQKEHDKKMAEYHREMRKKEQEHYRELAKNEWEYYKELRKRKLEHLKDCHHCFHEFYHRRTRTPIAVDTELVFRNGSIQVRL